MLQSTFVYCSIWQLQTAKASLMVSATLCLWSRGHADCPSSDEAAPLHLQPQEEGQIHMPGSYASDRRHGQLGCHGNAWFLHAVSQLHLTMR
jgi:hypothetical protein